MTRTMIYIGLRNYAATQGSMGRGTDMDEPNDEILKSEFWR